MTRDLAPTGRDLLYILAPAPNTAVGKVDWAAAGPAYTDRIVQTVSDRLPSLGVDAELLHVVDPADWARQGMFAGTPFALAHTFGADRSVPAGQHRARDRQRGPRRILHRARESVFRPL